MLFIVLATGCQRPIQDSFPRSAYRRTVMGCEGMIVVPGETTDLMVRAVDKAFARIDRLEHAISDWLLNSEVNRLSKIPEVDHKISEDFAEALRQSRFWHGATEGLFDPTIGPLTKRWRAAREANTLPSDYELLQIQKAVGWEKLIFKDDEDVPTLRFTRSEMGLDFGAIGKGLAADLACEVLREEGYSSAVVSIGGDLAISDAPPNRKGWRIDFFPKGIGGFTEKKWSNVGIAISGDTEQEFDIEGERHSHFIEVKTGRATPQGVSIVVAKNGVIADAVATCLLLMPEELIDKWALNYSDIVIFAVD